LAKLATQLRTNAINDNQDQEDQFTQGQQEKLMVKILLCEFSGVKCAIFEE